MMQLYIKDAKDCQQTTTRYEEAQKDSPTGLRESRALQAP